MSNNRKRNNKSSVSPTMATIRKELKKERKAISAESNGKVDIRRIKTILPEVTVMPMMQYTRRYIASSATSGVLTIAHLIDTHTVATTTTNLTSIMKAVRLVKMRMLAPVTTQGTTVTLSVQPFAQDSGNNNFNSIPEVFLDTSASIDKPAYLCLKPSIDTPLGSWHFTNTTTSTLANISFPQGTTLDLFMEGIPNISNALVNYTRTVAGAVVGTQYVGNIATNFVPVGVNNL